MKITKRLIFSLFLVVQCAYSTVTIRSIELEASKHFVSSDLLIQLDGLSEQLYLPKGAIMAKQTVFPKIAQWPSIYEAMTYAKSEFCDNHMLFALTRFHPFRSGPGVILNHIRLDSPDFLNVSFINVPGTKTIRCE